MAYIVKSRPSGNQICRVETEKQAVLLISAMESVDVQEDHFEPDTYYWEEVPVNG